MDVFLNPQLTLADQAVILKYLKDRRSLSKAEWKTALAAFDLLGRSRVVQEGKSSTFSQFYQAVFDRPFATRLLMELPALNDVEREGPLCAERLGQQAWAQQTAAALRKPQTPEQFLLTAYCLYWWSSFAKGYIAEIAVFRDLTASGIRFQSHDLAQPEGRFSQDDLTLSGMRGDIKSSAYFLNVARSHPLRHDFYITEVITPPMRQRRRVVFMLSASWDKIDGETNATSLEEALSQLPTSSQITVREQSLIVSDYEVWKEKIRSLQQQELNHE